MRVVEYGSDGSAESMQLAQVAQPTPGPGEILIEVHFAGVNRPDVLQRKGHYPVPAGASDIPGLELAGTIVDGDAAALAAGGFAIGDRVCALVAGGGYAEACTVPIGQMLPVPAGFSDIEAAALPENFFTVWSNVFDRGRLAAGEWLLVQGGTSGIGVTAIQLGKAFGAKVISHGRYVAFQMAEVAIPRNVFEDILRLIAELRIAASRINYVRRSCVTRSPETHRRSAS